MLFEHIFHFLFGIVAVYFAVTSFYLFVLAVSGRFFYREAFAVDSGIAPVSRIAILIPAYKEDNIIVSTVRHLGKLDYPRTLFDIYVLADSFRKSTLDELALYPVQIVDVVLEQSTKVGALKIAMKLIEGKYDVVLIIDADNVLKSDFLKIVDAYISSGVQVFQGRRVAKNLGTSFSVLDGCTEEMGHVIYRKGANALGLSSSVIGSGMAFKASLFRDLLAGISAIGGFDKILQVEVVKMRKKIWYSEKAVVFDEKVSTAEAFERQRKRWLASQFIYLKKFVPPFLRTYLWEGNWEYFRHGILNNLILPRSFYLMAIVLFTSLSVGLKFQFTYLYAASCFLYLASLLISVPKEYYDKSTLKALLSVPKALAIMILSGFRSKESLKTFIHTEHSETEISNKNYRI